MGNNRLGRGQLCGGTESNTREKCSAPLTSEDTREAARRGLPQRSRPGWKHTASAPRRRGAGSRTPPGGATELRCAASGRDSRELLENTAFPVARWVGTSRVCDSGCDCGRDFICPASLEDASHVALYGFPGGGGEGGGAVHSLEPSLRLPLPPSL